ncbi:MAG: hypothetical protein WDO56_28855 [Gammaproteobacteria bacterium]
MIAFVALGSSQKSPAFRVLAELESSDGVCNQPSLGGREITPPGRRQGTAPRGVILEMIEPDFQIGVHRGRLASWT